MTDRYAAFVVTLNRDTRDDDAEAVMTALRMVRGVASVVPVTGLDTSTREVAEGHARNGVLLRNSRAPDGPSLFYDHEEWQVFIAEVKRGDFDDPSVMP